MTTALRDGAMFLALTERLLEEGYHIRFRAHGDSMLPTISDGEAVTVGPVDPAAVKGGDVLLYRQRRRPLAHRVVKIHLTGDRVLAFVLRGDAKAGCDAPVAPDQVLGKVLSTERRGRHFAAITWRLRLARAAISLRW